jgi:glycolate oxidase iron-sulfur subunit
MATPLRLAERDLDACVSCGLCLPHCPTFRVTGEESYSPRGRIDAMRAVERDGLPIDAPFVEFMETCVQCRGCEPACPSGVPFGSLMADTREALVSRRASVPWWQRPAYRLLRHHRALLVASTGLALAQRLRLVPRRIALPDLPLRRASPLVSTGDDVWLFTGCVMDAWQRDTHHATAALVGAVGGTYRVPGPGADCCGALHHHAGLHAATVATAESVIASMPGDAPILVNSAGCGAALKEYGELLGTPAAAAFSGRVLDVHEWLAPRLGGLGDQGGDRPKVIVHDPCHLRHVQRAHLPVRTVLGEVADTVELHDAGLCCGAGGAYSALEPEMAAAVRRRKVAAIRRAAEASGATVVASANPGCILHLRGELDDIGIRHPIDIVAEALGLTPS